MVTYDDETPQKWQAMLANCLVGSQSKLRTYEFLIISDHRQPPPAKMHGKYAGW